MKKLFVSALLIVSCCAVFAKDGDIVLPEPDLKGGKPFMQCVAERRTSRSFSAEALPLQTVSEILFVADGITRKDGRKTVPTARNKQNQSVYAFTSDGVYLYNAKKHQLELKIKGDHRAKCGLQDFHKVSPLVLVFVSDMDAVGNTEQQQALYAGNHSGSASQNVYLYAASKGLSTVVCGLLNRKQLKELLKLADDHMVIFSQPIGYPGK
jgi:nitroreductase